MKVFEDLRNSLAHLFVYQMQEHIFIIIGV